MNQGFLKKYDKESDYYYKYYRDIKTIESIFEFGKVMALEEDPLYLLNSNKILDNSISHIHDISSCGENCGENSGDRDIESNKNNNNNNNKKNNINNNKNHLNIINNNINISFLDNIKNIIINIENNKLNIIDLYSIIIKLKSNKNHNIDTTRIDLLSYDQAIEIFKLFDTSLNQVSRIFIVFQFFNYYNNKKDKNKREFSNFIAKIITDESVLVTSCFYNFQLIARYFITITQSIYYQIERLDIVIQSKDRRDSFINKLIVLARSYLTRNNFYSLKEHFDHFLERNLPTKPNQYFYYIAIHYTLKEISGFRYLSNDTYKTYLKLSLGKGSINNIKISKSPPQITIDQFLEFRKKLKLSHENYNQFEKIIYNNIEYNGEIIQKIINFTLFNSAFLGFNSNSNDFKKLILQTKETILSLASVSKRFHFHLGRYLENSNFGVIALDKILSTEISYGKAFSLIQKPPLNIRYDTLIRTTPFEFVYQVFSQIESLTIVGDKIETYKYDLETFSRYELDSVFNTSLLSFVTLPPPNSFLFLKKLTIIGRSYSNNLNTGKTGGLGLLSYLISNTSSIEEFIIFNQQSYNHPEIFDIGIIKKIISSPNRSNLKLICLKYYIVSQAVEIYPKILELIKKEGSSNNKFKIQFYFSNNYNNGWKKFEIFSDKITSCDINQLKENLEIENQKCIKSLPIIAIEGFNNNQNEIDKFKYIISALGGVYQPNINKNITHLIVKEPVVSNLVIASVAAGAYVLKPSFLLDSFENGKFKDEKNYIFTRESDNGIGEIFFSSYLCHQLTKKNNKRLFEGSNIGYYDKNDGNCKDDIIFKILECGNARLTPISSQTKDLNFLLRNRITHFLILNKHKSYQEVQDVEQLILKDKNYSNVKLLYSSQIINYLINNQYLIPLPDSTSPSSSFSSSSSLYPSP